MNAFMVNLLCTLAGMAITFCFSYLAFRRAERKEHRDEGENKGVIMSELGYIKSSTDDIKREQREVATKISGLSERVTRCEESCKQAHNRINEIKMHVDERKD